MEEGTDKIPFLDVLVKKQDTKLMTDIYYKSTDTHQYLHFNSCHPNHTKMLYHIIEPEGYVQ